MTENNCPFTILNGGEQRSGILRLGLGVVATKARRVTNDMFLAAADTLANMVSEADLAQGSLYPPLKDMRSVSATIAAAARTTGRNSPISRAPQTMPR